MALGVSPSIRCPDQAPYEAARSAYVTTAIADATAQRAALVSASSRQAVKQVGSAANEPFRNTALAGRR